MKLYAQIGHQLGDKVTRGLGEGLIDGAVFSPKDLQPSTIAARISDTREGSPDADVLLDPQFYVSLFADSPAAHVGNLAEWDFFRAYRKSELEIARTVDSALREYFEEVSALDVTAVIAPNIYVSQSLDSREAVIAKNFIRQARSAYEKIGDNRPLFATLAICREALQDRHEFEEFLNDITILDEPPDGFYVIIGGRATEARSDFFHTDVLSNWMLLNLSLQVNGFQVINGYADILAPFLGMAGAHAGATGWWSNLRMFSMDRFFPAGGGRQPVYRYLSKALLNRITFAEKEAIAPFVPAVVNGLPHDADYSPEPDRAAEALQSWEALKSLCDAMVAGDLREDLTKCRDSVARAEQAYADIAAEGIPLDAKSRDEHLLALREALRQFEERAQL